MADYVAGRDYFSQSTTTSTVTDGNKTTITEITTVDSDGGTVVTDVQVIPKMREIDIAFVTYRIRPDRQHWYYFDNKNMSHFIARPNVIKLDTKDPSKFPNLLNPPGERLNIVGGNAKILMAETDFNSGNVVLYISAIEGAKSNVKPGNTVTCYRKTGITSPTTTLIGLANVSTYEHYSGKVRGGSNTNYVFLSLDAHSVIENYYTGNVLTIVKGTSAGESAQITAYNVQTRKVTVSPTFSSMSANSTYSIGDPRSSYATNTVQGHWSTNKGHITGTLHLPNPSSNSMYSFFTGDRLFRILDNPREDLTDYTSRSEYMFHSFGLKVDKAQIINRTVYTNTTTITTNTVYQVGNPKLSMTVAHDPIAQSFKVDENSYPEGVFVSSIDLYFKNKSDWSGVEVQIRPLENGYPSQTEVLPMASAYAENQDIKVSNFPNVSNSLTATKFTFPAPVFLNSNKDYAFIILTDDYDFDIYVSEVGYPSIAGTPGRVTRQPFLGSMFKSENATTWKYLQDQDVMFKINKCKFVSTGTLQFNELKEENKPLPYGATANTYVANAVYDLFQVHSDGVELPGTKLQFNYRATSNSSKTLDSTYTEIIPNDNEVLTEQKVIFGPGIQTLSFYYQIEMSTENTDVSPVVFYNRQNMVPQKMLINNMELTNTLVVIANTGASYANADTIAFTGPSGGGATGNLVVNSTGAIQSINMLSSGSGYFDNVTATITTSTGTGATLLVSGEAGKSGGPAVARYISKTVVLGDGLDAGDLRVYVTAAKPRASEVTVYYKVRNALDPETIAEKSWTKMYQYGNEYKYSDPVALNPIEYEYRPSLSANNISYSTTANDSGLYSTFNEFKIKIVLTSTSSLAPDIPVLFDVRSIALPADIF